MKRWKQIRLEQTCGACPEQYNAYLDGEYVAYLRLRHGYFRVEVGEDTVYESTTIGYGMFDWSERDKHLKKAKKAIAKFLKKQKK